MASIYNFNFRFDNWHKLWSMIDHNDKIINQVPVTSDQRNTQKYTQKYTIQNTTNIHTKNIYTKATLTKVWDLNAIKIMWHPSIHKWNTTIQKTLQHNQILLITTHRILQQNAILQPVYVYQVLWWIPPHVFPFADMNESSVQCSMFYLHVVLWWSPLNSSIDSIQIQSYCC